MNYIYILTKIENNILYVTLNRPQKHNALCIDMVIELNHAFTEANNIRNIKALFLLGNDKAFSAGGDLIEMKALDQKEAEKRSAFVQTTFQLLNEIEVPVVAFISGICFGGGLELAMHCDFCICADNTRLALPEVRYGMIPGAGGTVQLPIHLGNADASFYLLTGDDIPLNKALNAGLIQNVVLLNAFKKELSEQAEYFGKASKEALVAIKKMLRENSKTNLREIYKKEAMWFSSLLSKKGHKEIESKFEKN